MWDWTRQILARFGDALRDAALRRLAEGLIGGILVLTLLLLPRVRAWLLSAHPVTAPGFVLVLAVVLIAGIVIAARLYGVSRKSIIRPRAGFEFILEQWPQTRLRLRKDIVEKLKALHREGAELQEEIANDHDESRLPLWERSVLTWREEVKRFLLENVSPDKAVYVDTIQPQPDVTVRMRGQVFTKRRGYVLRDLQLRLERLAAMVKILAD